MPTAAAQWALGLGAPCPAMPCQALPGPAQLPCAVGAAFASLCFALICSDLIWSSLCHDQPSSDSGSFLWEVIRAQTACLPKL